MSTEQITTVLLYSILFIFFFNDTATTEIYTLSLHDALPIWSWGDCSGRSAEGEDAPLRNCGGRAGATAAVWEPIAAHQGPGGEAEAGAGALESGDYRALCLTAGDL